MSGVHLFPFDQTRADQIAPAEAARLVEAFRLPGESVWLQTFADGPDELYALEEWTDAKGQKRTTQKYQLARESGVRSPARRTAAGGNFTLEQIKAGQYLHENQARVGVFWTVNVLKPDAQRRTADAVARVAAVFVDLDGAPLPADGFHLLPTAVVESSPGRFHAYWAVHDLPLEDFTATQKHLAALYGGDVAVNDLPRVMRLPGYWHGKREPGSLTRILELNPDAQYSRAELLAAFPGLADTLAATEAERECQVRDAQQRRAEADQMRAELEGGKAIDQAQAQRNWARVALLGGLADLLGAVEGTRNSTLNAVAFRLGRIVTAGLLDEAEVRTALGEVAERVGLGQHETAQTLGSGLESGKLDPVDPSKIGALAGARKQKARVKETAARLSDGDSEAGDTAPKLPKGGAGDLPEIIVNERHLREIADDAQAALLTANRPPRYFQRGGEFVRLAGDESGTRIRHLDAVALKGVLARVADFMRVTERTEEGADGKKKVVTDTTPARPPADLAPDLLARTEDLGLPVLRTLARSPIYDPGGTLVSAEGYHAGSGIYLALQRLTVPELPTVPDALALLGELLTDFPFSPQEAGFAHTLAALLLPFVRPMIDGPTPLHLIEAPTRGSGKGLLAEVIAHVTVGGPAGVMVQPRDGDEFEKRVTSILLEGAPVVLLDNVHTLKGEALAAALTTPMWRGRRLGKSEMLTLPNGALWLATGNNVTLDDDMPRRIIPIRLDPGVERPEERSGFRHPDLLAWIKVNRPALVAACLSLVEAWKAAGRPRGTARLGSFESWTATIGGILEVAGVPGFLTAREGLYETANAEPQEWAGLLTALHERHGGESIGAREVLAAMKALDLCSDYWEGKLASSALKRVGKAVSSRRDRVFGGHRIRLAGKTGTGNIGYRIEPAGQGVKKTPETPKTPEAGEETASSTAFPQNSVSEQTPGVSGVFAGNTGQTPEKHRTLHSGPEGVKGVSGVFGVLNRPSLESRDVLDL